MSWFSVCGLSFRVLGRCGTLSLSFAAVASEAIRCLSVSCLFAALLHGCSEAMPLFFSPSPLTLVFSESSRWTLVFPHADSPSGPVLSTRRWVRAGILLQLAV
eukprot:3498165-Rhodomonas_salina.2